MNANIFSIHKMTPNKRTLLIKSALEATLRAAAAKKVRLSPSPSTSTSLPTTTIANDQQEQFSILLSLKDDYLSTIFSYLSMTDLCAVADCCRRFCKLAELIVQKRCQQQGDELFLDHHQFVDATNHLFLEKFGSVIPHLAISGYIFQQWPAGLDAKLKNFTSLKSLLFYNMDLSILPENSMVLRKIQDLHIIGAYNESKCQFYCKLIKSCRALKKLCIGVGAKISDALVACINEHHSIEGVYLIVHDNQYRKKMQKLKKLKKLRMNFQEQFHSISHTNLRVTAIITEYTLRDSFEHLVLFDFDPNDVFFQALDKFKHLKKCEIFARSEISEGWHGCCDQFQF